MEQVSSDQGADLPEVWQTYQKVINTAERREVTAVVGAYSETVCNKHLVFTVTCCC